MTLERELAYLVQEFVRQVAELAQRVALESMRAALGPRGLERPLQIERPGSRGARANRRTEEDLRAMERALVAFVEQHPGLRVEQINKALGTKTRELERPIRRLIASGVLRVQGQKRATRYSVAAVSGGN